MLSFQVSINFHRVSLFTESNAPAKHPRSTREVGPPARHLRGTCEAPTTHPQEKFHSLDWATREAPSRHLRSTHDAPAKSQGIWRLEIFFVKTTKTKLKIIFTENFMIDKIKMHLFDEKMTKTGGKEKEYRSNQARIWNLNRHLTFRQHNYG